MGRASSPGAGGKPSDGGKAELVSLVIQPSSPFYCRGVPQLWELAGACSGTVGGSVLSARQLFAVPVFPPAAPACDTEVLHVIFSL